MYSVNLSIWVSLIVCWVFLHKERTPEELATYHSRFLIPVESILLLLGSSNKGIIVHRSPITRVAPSTSVAPIFTVAPHQVRHSPIFSDVCHQVHQSPISGVTPSTSVAPIDTVAPSTSVPFTNLQCYAFYKGCTNLNCCACYKCYTHHHCCTSTVAPFYSVAPFICCYFMPCDYATRQFHIINNLATNVNMPCQLFNCIVEI